MAITNGNALDFCAFLFISQLAHASCEIPLLFQPTVIVVGLLFNSSGQVLLGQRQLPQDHIGLWEFPGGKLEPSDSSPESALAREWKEEVGSEIVVRELIFQQDRIFDGNSLQIKFYRVQLKSNQDSPTAIVHSRLSWVGQDELSLHPFIIDDHPIWKVIWP